MPLAPCPFCACTDKLAEKCSSLNDVGFCGTAKVWYVFCYRCAIRGPIRETKQQAIEAWATREQPVQAKPKPRHTIDGGHAHC